MSKKANVTNVESVERRKHWRDRRNGDERRNPVRINVGGEDCRSGQPRREADLAGELADGDVWWNKEGVRYD